MSAWDSAGSDRAGPDRTGRDQAGSDHDGSATASVVEVRATATAALIPTIRAVASDLAARADFDLDAISDLRMAVDEACATLVDVATSASHLSCTFRMLPDRIQVRAEVEAQRGGATVSTDTFGWRVLETLTDEASVQHSVGPDGRGDTVCIVLEKRAGATTR